MDTRPSFRTPEMASRMARTLFQEWGVPEDLASQYAAGSTEFFPRVLAAAQDAIRKRGLFACPAAFEGGDDVQGFPAPVEREWRSCERTLGDAGVSGVMMHLPLFWQLASPLRRAARGANVPLFINQPENVPLAGAALAYGGSNAVVSEPGSAARLLKYLKEKNMPEPKLWLLVRQATEKDWQLPEHMCSETSAVVQEVHLYPGIGLLEQCSLLARKEDVLFHANDAYLWEFGGTETRITSTADPLPLIRHLLPFTLHAQGSCPCGRESVSPIR